MSFASIRRVRPGARYLLLGLAFTSFVSLGLPDGLLGVAWPSIRADFRLGLDALGALFLTTTTGYAASSMAAGPLAARLGVGALLALSTGATAVSLLGYALAPGWMTMTSLGLLAGAGGGAIDAALNAYAASHYSARTINLLHAFYGVGVTMGPLIMTSVLVAHLSWKFGYVMVAGAQLALALCFVATARFWPASSPAHAASGAKAVLLDTAKLGAVRLAMLVFFVYVGLEAAAGAWMFSLLYEDRGFGMGPAGLAVSLYWGGLLAGRVAYALLPWAYPSSTVVTCCMVVASFAVSVVALDLPGHATLAGVTMLGMASGPIFPLLIATTPGRVGQIHAANAVGLQIGASALGVAVFPAGSGIIADGLGLSALPVALVGLWVTLLGAHLCLVRVAAPRPRSPAGQSKVSNFREGDHGVANENTPTV